MKPSDVKKLAAQIMARPFTIETYSDDPDERYSLLDTAQELARLIVEDGGAKQ